MQSSPGTPIPQSVSPFSIYILLLDIGFPIGIFAGTNVPCSYSQCVARTVFSVGPYALMYLQFPLTCFTTSLSDADPPVVITLNVSISVCLKYCGGRSVSVTLFSLTYFSNAAVSVIVSCETSTRVAPQYRASVISHTDASKM